MGKQVVLVHYCTTTPNNHQTTDTTAILKEKNLLGSSYGDPFFKWTSKQLL